MKILDVGCGYNKIEGAVGMDNNPMVNPNILHDIEKIPYPFDDNEFDMIHCSQVLEHTNDIIPIMKELHRIGKCGAKLHIIVPHFSGKTAYMDPSHKCFFAWPTFTYFTRDYFYTDTRYKMVAQHLSFSKINVAIGVQFFANKFPRFYEDYLHGLFPARNIGTILEIIKP